MGKSSLVNRLAAKRVAVVEDGVAHIRKISLVRDLGTSVEVNAGVSKGD